MNIYNEYVLENYYVIVDSKNKIISDKRYTTLWGARYAKKISHKFKGIKCTIKNVKTIIRSFKN